MEGSLFCDAEQVAGAVSQNPDDVTVKSCYELAGAMGRAYFYVGQVVAYQFAAFHAERNELVAGLPWADGNGAAQEQ